MANKILGFTLIEMLLTLSILAIALTLVSGFGFGFIEKHTLLKERETLIKNIKQSQQDTIIAKEGRWYGLNFGEHSYDLIAENITGNIKTVTFNNSISLDTSSCSQIQFEKLTGKLDADSACSLTIKSRKFTSEIIIETTGLVSVSSPLPE